MCVHSVVPTYETHLKFYYRISVHTDTRRTKVLKCLNS